MKLGTVEEARSKFVEVMILMVGEATKPKDKVAIHSDLLRERLSGSPHYASADSEIESDGSISICRISIGPSRVFFLQNRIGKARVETLKVKIKIDVQARPTGAPLRLEDQE